MERLYLPLPSFAYVLTAGVWLDSYVTMKLTRQFQKFFMELDVKTAITNAAGDTTRLKVRHTALVGAVGCLSCGGGP